jgi:N-acetylglucosaminyldiphosphoundecaprenol N-acetyl-beta-D-mannosaminyltransferase
MNATAALLQKSEPQLDLRVPIGPVEVDTLPRERLIEKILDSALHASFTHHVATINAQFYVLAECDRVFRDCLKRAEFVCADGVSIGLAASVLTGQKIERLAGVDLIEEICRRGAQHGLRVFLLGGRPGSAVRLSEMLQNRYPGVEIAGTACPSVGFEKNTESLAAVLDQMHSVRPHLVFAALGAPKQELFIDQYLRNLKIPVAVGVGGSFEIITGVTHRAPRIIQRVGLEWLYRLCQEPRRLWRRYILGNPYFLWIMARYWFARRKLAMEGDATGELHAGGPILARRAAIRSIS